MKLTKPKPYQLVAASLSLVAIPPVVVWLVTWPRGLPGDVSSWRLPFLFSTLTAAAVCFPLQISRHRKLTMQEPVHFASFLLFGPPVALVAAIAGVLTGSAVLIVRRKRRIHDTLFNTGKTALAISASSAVYFGLAGYQVPFRIEFAPNYYALPLAAAAMFGVETWLPTLMAGYQLRKNPLRLWLSARRIDLPQMVALYLIGITAAVTAQAQPWSVLVMALPSAPIYISLRRTIRFLDTHIDEPSVSALAAMADAIDARRPHTAEHSRRVARVAEQLARAMELPEAEVHGIRLAARVHDLGMVGVPEDILSKPGPLTAEERAAVRRHVEVGYEIVSRFAEFNQVRELVLLHHERWDSDGGLAHDQSREEHNHLLLGAQIIGVADAWVALTCDRPYRAALSPDQAFEQIRSLKGEQWHPDVVDTLEAIMKPARVQALPFWRAPVACLAATA